MTTTVTTTIPVTVSGELEVPVPPIGRELTQFMRSFAKAIMVGIIAACMISAPKIAYMGTPPAQGIQAIPATTKHAVVWIPITTINAAMAVMRLLYAPAHAAGEPAH